MNEELSCLNVQLMKSEFSKHSLEIFKNVLCLHRINNKITIICSDRTEADQFVWPKELNLQNTAMLQNIPNTFTVLQPKMHSFVAYEVWDSSNFVKQHFFRINPLYVLTDISILYVKLLTAIPWILDYQRHFLSCKKTKRCWNIGECHIGEATIK